MNKLLLSSILFLVSLSAFTHPAFIKNNSAYDIHIRYFTCTYNYMPHPSEWCSPDEKTLSEHQEISLELGSPGPYHQAVSIYIESITTSTGLQESFPNRVCNAGYNMTANIYIFDNQIFCKAK